MSRGLNIKQERSVKRVAERNDRTHHLGHRGTVASVENGDFIIRKPHLDTLDVLAVFGVNRLGLSGSQTAQNERSHARAGPESLDKGPAAELLCHDFLSYW